MENEYIYTRFRLSGLFNEFRDIGNDNRINIKRKEANPFYLMYPELLVNRTEKLYFPKVGVISNYD